MTTTIVLQSVFRLKDRDRMSNVIHVKAWKKACRPPGVVAVIFHCRNRYTSRARYHNGMTAYNHARGVKTLIATANIMKTLIDIGADANKICDAKCRASSPSPPPAVRYNSRDKTSPTPNPQNNVWSVASRGDTAVAIHTDELGFLANHMGNNNVKGTTIKNVIDHDTSFGH